MTLEELASLVERQLTDQRVRASDIEVRVVANRRKPPSTGFKYGIKVHYSVAPHTFFLGGTHGHASLPDAIAAMASAIRQWSPGRTMSQSQRMRRHRDEGDN